MQDYKPFVQAEEIATRLGVPRHFISKILKRLVKASILSSSKGKMGGFSVSATTRSVLLSQLYDITDGIESFKRCSLRLRDCDASAPCPLHGQIEGIKGELMDVLSKTTIGDLLKEDKEEFIRSIATGY